MIYQPELYYFYDGNSPKQAFLMQAVLVTAETIGSFSENYKTRLISPKGKIESKERSGSLLGQSEEKILQTKTIVNWIFNESMLPDTFYLIIGYDPRDKEEIAKFDHHDDTDCWALNLTKEEFEKLQEAWEKSGLPTDLFYPEDKGIQEKNHYYTPKQWANKAHNN